MTRIRSPRAVRASLNALRSAALDRTPVRGLTHRFYRYPARFSPTFAAAAIEAFSEPGELVLDPFMGGGTAIVESIIRGRRAVGNDLNSLAVFVARVKTTCINDVERRALERWTSEVVPALNYRAEVSSPNRVYCRRRTRNLSLPIARPIKKVIALALEELTSLPSRRARDFARCALLNVAQLALNGRTRSTPLWEFRELLDASMREMLAGIEELRQRLPSRVAGQPPPQLMNINTGSIADEPPFAGGVKADLVVTSPPYPGIHILYHRWQVDGRRETPAPYWIAGCNDGQGAAYYNFADRHESGFDGYFQESLRTLQALRRVMKDGAFIVQLVAFGEPRNHLSRFLENMEVAEFREFRTPRNSNGKTFRRTWRDVPNRRWHANLKGALHSSREVVLIHQAS